MDIFDKAIQTALVMITIGAIVYAGQVIIQALDVIRGL
jgi:hypothetical protein